MKVAPACRITVYANSLGTTLDPVATRAVSRTTRQLKRTEDKQCWDWQMTNQPNSFQCFCGNHFPMTVWWDHADDSCYILDWNICIIVCSWYKEFWCTLLQVNIALNRNNQTMIWQNPGKIVSDNVNYYRHCSAWFYWFPPSENKEKILTLFYNLVVPVTVIFCSISSQLLICQIVQTSIIHFDNWREMIFNFFWISRQ